MMRDLGRAERRVPGRATMRIADLGRNLRLPAEDGALNAKPLAEEGLARPAAIGVGGVEPPQPDAPGMIEQLQRLRVAIARAAQLRRRADPAEIAAAEEDPVDVALVQHLVRSTPDRRAPDFLPPRGKADKQEHLIIEGSRQVACWSAEEKRWVAAPCFSARVTALRSRRPSVAAPRRPGKRSPKRSR